MTELAEPQLPPVVSAWIEQLKDPAFITMIESWPAEQIDVRLSASKGRVRRTPEVRFNSGPSEYVRP